MIISFATGILPVIPPSFPYWEEHNGPLDRALIKLIWFFWLMQQIIMIIVLLNFLVAKIVDSYHDSLNDYTKTEYIVKMTLIDEVYTPLETWYTLRQKFLSTCRSKKNLFYKQNDPINICCIVDTT